MNRSDLISSFTPSTMTPENLQAIFVKREPLARRIIESIHAGVERRDLEHHVVVGPRGMGKTHLLSLIVHRLRADPAVADEIAIAWLREEEWGVTSVGELYEQILNQLADDPDVDPAVRGPAAEGARTLVGVRDDDALANAGEHLIRSVLGDRLLVVVAENLDLLFDNIGEDDQHRLRAFLQNDRNTVLLASTPALSSTIATRDGLFFGFFAIHHLDELTVDEARDLLRHIAQLAPDDECRDLVAYLSTEEATTRLEVIQHLAGGHPRLWVLLSECVTTERLEELVGLLLAVLDDLTPYYQSQMRELSGAQRKVVMALARAEGAIPVKEIAKLARVPERSTAKHLGDLGKLGYVRQPVLPGHLTTADKRSRHYELREPLLRHCLEVKATRGAPLRLVVEFLRVWFDAPRLWAWAENLPSASALYASAALETRDDPAQSTQTHERLRDAEAHAALGDHGSALDTFEAVLAQDQPNAVAMKGRANALLHLGQWEASVDAFRDVLRLTPEDPRIWFGIGLGLEQLRRFDDALDAYDRALALDPEAWQIHFSRGLVFDQLGQFPEAIEALAEARWREPDTWGLNWHLIRLLVHVHDDRWREHLDDLFSSFAGDFRAIHDLYFLVNQLEADVDGSMEHDQALLVEKALKHDCAEPMLDAIATHLADLASGDRPIRPVWLKGWCDAFDAVGAQGVVAEVVRAAHAAAWSGDTSAILGLPEEVRELALQLTATG